VSILARLFQRFPEYYPSGTRIVTAQIPEGYTPPSASMDPDATAPNVLAES